ncbi:MAG: phospho-N-acetylmuramoyl-pentapeptide-transferase [Mycobacteriales bacterium]
MRSVLAASMVAFLVSIFCTPLAIKYLRRLKIGQEIRTEGPKHHQSKAGTPTMGGIVFILATLVAYGAAQLLVINQPSRGVTVTALVVLGLFVGMGAVGFVDDYIKVRRRRSLGLNKRGKLLGQIIVAAVFAVIALQFPNSRNAHVGSLYLSFVRDIDWAHIGTAGAAALFAFVIIATANGVNLTDGLDGLATGSSVMVLVAYFLIGLWQYRHTCGIGPAGYCYEIRDPLDIALISAAGAGACFGFLWWNASPAKIFMGDTGALGLGGLIGGLAMATHTTLLLPLLGLLFVIITMSVVIQIGSFQLTGKRVFRMAPLQHHFELGGWSEVNIVIRFWIISGIGVGAGLGIFYCDYLGVL